MNISLGSDVFSDATGPQPLESRSSPFLRTFFQFLSSNVITTCEVVQGLVDLLVIFLQALAFGYMIIDAQVVKHSDYLFLLSLILVIDWIEINDNLLHIFTFSNVHFLLMAIYAF
jgi:hypothetical protein